MADEELNKLVKKRSTIKGQLTRFKTFMQTLPASTETNQNLVRQVEARLEKFVSIIDCFNDIQMDIDLLDNQAQQITSEQERDSFEDAYFKLVSEAKQFIADKSSTTAINFEVLEQASSRSSDHLSSNVRLPKMNLPSFSGSYENWYEFKDMFSSLIDSKQNINDIEKFYYLRSSLKNEAAEVIQAIEMTGENYQVAWNLIRERYDNKRLIIHNHVSALFELPSLNKESHSQLRKLLDTFLKHLRSLHALKQPTEQWDTLLIHIVSKKLDPITAREWELYKITGDLPTMVDMQAFLKQRCDLLEKLHINSDKGKLNSVPKNSKGFEQKQYTKAFVSTDNICVFCKGSHAIHSCEKFLKLEIGERINQAKNLRLCINCLKKNHYTRNCKAGSCKKCGKRHSTLLHLEFPNNLKLEAAQSDTNLNLDVNAGTHAISSLDLSQINLIQRKSENILLSTAKVRVFDKQGQAHDCRALLDNGAQSNFISQNLCNLLGLQKENINMSIVGINQIESNIKHSTSVKMESCFNKFGATLSCLVVTKICDDLPSFFFDVSELKIPQNINLADPNYGKPGKIDMLIGASVFWNLICMGQIKLGKGQPVLRKTTLGWIISGPIANTKLFHAQKTYCGFSANLDVQEQLNKFWELEEPPKNRVLSNEEVKCEQHFQETVRQRPDGRFMVHIPFKDSIDKLGDSEKIAIKRFYSLERRLQANPDLHKQYSKFMCEYEDLGHMSRVQNQDLNAVKYYMPHHGVLKADSLTTKLRVVFDGSSKSTSGYSINDLQMVGPVIQDDLLALTMRFRKHAYVITADITKMYRQVLVSHEQTSLQRIVWRENPSDPLMHFNLNTVTYGTAAASYLAIRALQEVARRHLDKYPKSANIILTDFYVDDLLTGAGTVEEATTIADEVAKILRSGCFELRKWASNSPQILKNIENCNLADVLEIGGSEHSKTLGLYWYSEPDILKYNIKPTTNIKSVTKRNILSNVAKIFDPLGLLGPCIIIAKIILQTLWQYKLTWDESVPLDLYTKWLRFQSGLYLLNDIKIPRPVICTAPISIEMHGFSDASEEAYGACIYLRSIDNQGNITVRLLCSKTRVAPLKSVSIPRLELCGALVLAQMAEKASNSLGIQFIKRIFWCDSTIALAWIKSEPHTLKTFVANRVTEIQNSTLPTEWLHVGTKDNPADLLSRGVNPCDILNCDLWWQGPPWLATHSDDWQNNQLMDLVDVPEVRPKCTFIVNEGRISHIFEKYSCLNTLQRAIGYWLRYINNLNTQNPIKQFGPLSTNELLASLKCLIRIAQRESYPQEIRDLIKNREVQKSSKLVALHPYLDESNIIRVGGRLQNSNFKFDKVHPIVLPDKHKLSTLIIRYEHLRLLHAGQQALLTSIRERYWPIRGRNQVKSIVRGCVKCFKVNPKIVTPLMGNLPEARLTPSFPFQNCGVDYAGPFSIKEKGGRGSKIFKAYVCLFVCFAVKAIHLEVVTDLTSESFLAAFRRFVSRRGKPASIYSDNGTNFVGSKTELARLGEFLTNQTNQEKLINAVACDNVSWHFIPARSPQFGGLWEAGIKSMKSHLKRTVGNASLTLIEFQTILTQIEGVLNSRPLSPLSDDPNDLNPITPSHFLIGRPITSLPDPNLREIPENRLSRFQRIQQILQHFWTRWSREYISELQQRVKWKRNSNPLLEIGAMVIIKEDNLPPLKWPIGRITQLHPGSDGLVRVVSIKTASSVLKRAVAKICILPVNV